MALLTARTNAALLGCFVLATCAAATSQTESNLRGNTSVNAVEQQSASAVAKQAANPLASMWLFQFQQNNNWMGMPLNHGNEVQSNLHFQPLFSVGLTDKWNLVARPVLPLYSSVPYVSTSSGVARSTGFGDTVFAFAVSPSQKLVGNWLVAAGPTFVFPTATESTLGQDNWQGGPTAALGYVGHHYLTYLFPQQWFKMGGDGKATKQMDAQYSYVHFFENGWTIGTQPDILVDWEAKPGNQVTFPVGLQVGKLRKVGLLPVKFDAQALYYPVHPEVYGPKWGAQLQITPVMPSLIKRDIF